MRLQQRFGAQCSRRPPCANSTAATRLAPGPAAFAAVVFAESTQDVQDALRLADAYERAGDCLCRRFLAGRPSAGRAGRHQHRREPHEPGAFHQRRRPDGDGAAGITRKQLNDEP